MDPVRAYVVQKLIMQGFAYAPFGKPIIFFSQEEVTGYLGQHYKPGTRDPAIFVFPTEGNLETTHYHKIPNVDTPVVHSVRLGEAVLPEVEIGANVAVNEDPIVAQGGKRKTRKRKSKAVRRR